jgi:hypothetical protein
MTILANSSTPRVGGQAAHAAFIDRRGNVERLGGCKIKFENNVAHIGAGRSWMRGVSRNSDGRTEFCKAGNLKKEVTRNGNIH